MSAANTKHQVCLLQYTFLLCFFHARSKFTSASVACIFNFEYEVIIQETGDFGVDNRGITMNFHFLDFVTNNSGR
jgi:hypothetical protein